MTNGVQSQQHPKPCGAWDLKGAFTNTQKCVGDLRLVLPQLTFLSYFYTLNSTLRTKRDAAGVKDSGNELPKAWSDLLDTVTFSLSYKCFSAADFSIKG